MLLALLFSILTATYTLSSTTSVEASGILPEGATHTYERSATTGQTGQMTAGNSTRLYLTGWEGCTIRTVTLSMRSNKYAGAGSLRMRIGNNEVWSIADEPFDSDAWVGQYTTDFVPICKHMQTTVDGDIEIIISATENSLYIQSYEIAYEEVVPTCHTVSFVTGLDFQPEPITQTAIGAELILPAWQDTAIWHFEGWSEIEVEDNDSVPSLMQPGTSYLPKKNTRLWAVYRDVDNILPISEMVSGEYVLTMHNDLTTSLSGSGMAMCDAVANKQIALCEVSMVALPDGGYDLCSPLAEAMVYDIAVLSDTTLQMTHLLTNSPIGHEARALSAEPSLWHYTALDDGSYAIYYPYDSKTYALYFGLDSYSDVVATAMKLDVAKWHKDGIWIFPALYATHTSWPFGKLEGVENIVLPNLNGQNTKCVMYFGAYELRINNGQKTLIIPH